MLKKKHRLESVKLFKPTIFVSENFLVRVSKNDLGIPRLAFVIPKKLDKRAVVRNRLRREFSSIIEQIFDKITAGNDFVFYPNAKSLSSKRNELEKEVTQVFKKGNFIND